MPHRRLHCEQTISPATRFDRLNDSSKSVIQLDDGAVIIAVSRFAQRRIDCICPKAYRIEGEPRPRRSCCLSDGETPRHTSPNFFRSLLSADAGGGSFIPVKGFQIIAHELLVEARRALPHGILVLWPKREESGVRHSSIKSKTPSTVPNSNFVSVTIIPDWSACARPRESMQG